MKNKKGMALGDLFAVAMTIIVLGIALTYGLTVQSDVRSDIEYCPTGYTQNATAGNCELDTNTSSTTAYINTEARTAATDGIEATAKISGKLGLIVTVIIAAIIIGILVRYLWVRFN